MGKQQLSFSVPRGTFDDIENQLQKGKAAVGTTGSGFNFGINLSAQKVLSIVTQSA
jgi:hypothetical protein